jgi:hypothetical protein
MKNKIKIEPVIWHGMTEASNNSCNSLGLDDQANYTSSILNKSSYEFKMIYAIILTTAKLKFCLVNHSPLHFCFIFSNKNINKQPKT